MRVQELETNEGILKMTQIRVHKMSRENVFFLKLIIPYIDALFKLLFGNNMLCVPVWNT